MRKQVSPSSIADPSAIADFSHGSNVPDLDPKKYAAFSSEQTYEYFFSDMTRQSMVQDPKCNVEVFNRVVKTAEEQKRPHQDDKKWFISDADLHAAGLDHWKDNQNG